MTSHDVVAAARRSLGERRIGHAGTLDPFATGLLVLMVGRATRLLPYIVGEPKRYRAVVRFGTETTTADLDGDVVATGARPTADAVLAALPALTGEVDQTPPVYSAKRIAGERAYDLARRGVEVEMRPVRVRVDEWRPHGWSGDDFDVEVVCGGGTYVRSLARDLGRLVGSAAHLAALRRLQSGPFDVADAMSLDALQSGGAAIRPPRDALGAIAEERLGALDVARVARGIAVDASVAGPAAALLNAENGALVAYAERLGNRWQPRVVMRPMGGA